MSLPVPWLLEQYSTCPSGLGEALVSCVVLVMSVLALAAQVRHSRYVPSTPSSKSKKENARLSRLYGSCVTVSMKVKVNSACVRPNPPMAASFPVAASDVAFILICARGATSVEAGAGDRDMPRAAHQEKPILDDIRRGL